MEERIPRQWLIIAERWAGKSTFGAAMSPEYLVCDLDGRWSEQQHVTGKSHVIRESDPLKLADELKKQRPQLSGYVNTILVDSGTAVLDYIGAKARLQDLNARETKGKFNMNDAHRYKADTMRLLRFSIVQWHCDYLWIFHTEESMESGNKKIRTTIPTTELERMKANLNGIFTIVRDKQGMRGIRVEWSRFRDNVAAGQVIWDTAGLWQGVPEKLDTFLPYFTGKEGYSGNAYSNEWLFNYLAGKGINFADHFEMYKALDIKTEPYWFDKNGWGALIKKALEPVK